jgi:hypothetical protein
MAIKISSNFDYQGSNFLDNRQHAASLEELAERTITDYPAGFPVYVESEKQWYELNGTRDQWIPRESSLGSDSVISSNQISAHQGTDTKFYTSAAIDKLLHDTPEQTKNLPSVEVGYIWNAPGGVIEDVFMPTSGNNSQSGYIKIKLADGEVGNIAASDLCFGLYHFSNSSKNSSETRESELKFAGYSSIFFEISEVSPSELLSGVECVSSYSGETAELKPVSGDLYRYFKFWTKTGSENPQPGMVWVAIGNREISSRQKCSYRTNNATKHLTGMSDWTLPIPSDRVTAQFGYLGDLYAQVSEQSGLVNQASLQGYDNYMTNLLVKGKLKQVDDNGQSISMLSFRGEWNPASVYYYADEVVYGSSLYFWSLEGQPTESAQSESLSVYVPGTNPGWTRVSGVDGISQIDVTYTCNSHPTISDWTETATWTPVAGTPDSTNIYRWCKTVLHYGNSQSTVTYYICGIYTESVITADLDNDSDIISTGTDGILDLENTLCLSGQARIWYGSGQLEVQSFRFTEEAKEILEEIFGLQENNTSASTSGTYGCKVLDQDSRVAKFWINLKPGSYRFSEGGYNLGLSISGILEGSVAERTVTYKLRTAKGGKDGCIYRIVTSSGSIKLGSTESIQVRAQETIGNVSRPMLASSYAFIFEKPDPGQTSGYSPFLTTWKTYADSSSTDGIAWSEPQSQDLSVALDTTTNLGALVQAGLDNFKIKLVDITSAGTAENINWSDLSGFPVLDEEVIYFLKDGVDGRTISNVWEYYAITASSAVPSKTSTPDCQWVKYDGSKYHNLYSDTDVLTFPQPGPSQQYLWNYEEIYSDTINPGTPSLLSSTNPVLVGKWSEDGRSIVGVTNYYAGSVNSVCPSGYPTEDGNTIPSPQTGSAWTTTPLTPTAGQPYVWGFEVTEWNTTPTYTVRAPHMICGLGAGIAQVIEFYKVTDSETPPANDTPAQIGTWARDLSVVRGSLSSETPYLWNFERSVSSDGQTVFETEPAIISFYSEDGRNCLEIFEYYRTTDSMTTPGSPYSVNSDIEASDDQNREALETAFTANFTNWACSKAPGFRMPETDPTNRFIWNFEILHWDKAPFWTVNPPHTVGVSGLNGETSFTNFMFCRSELDISSATVSGGSYASPSPENTIFSSLDGVQHELVWSDSVPSGDGDVWMIKRTYYQDATIQSTWSHPFKMTDSVDLDVEYSSSVTGRSDLKWTSDLIQVYEQACLALQITQDYSPEVGHEIHGKPGDPALQRVKKALGWSNTATDPVWMATSQFRSGSWGNWVYTKIKGEVPQIHLEASCMLGDVTRGSDCSLSIDGTSISIPSTNSPGGYCAFIIDPATLSPKESSGSGNNEVEVIYHVGASDLTTFLEAHKDSSDFVIIMSDGYKTEMTDGLRELLTEFGGKGIMQSSKWALGNRAYYFIGQYGLSIGQAYEGWSIQEQDDSGDTESVLVLDIPVTKGYGPVWKGRDGVDGRGISSIWEFYCTTSTPSVPSGTNGVGGNTDHTWIVDTGTGIKPLSGFNNATGKPELSDNQATLPSPTSDRRWLWNYEITFSESGSIISKTSPILIGTFSKPGRSLETVIEYYCSTQDPTEPVLNLGSEYSDNPMSSLSTWRTTPGIDNVVYPNRDNPYLWNVEVLKWKEVTGVEQNGTDTVRYVYTVNQVHLAASFGFGIKHIEEYYILTQDANTPSNSDILDWIYVDSSLSTETGKTSSAPAMKRSIPVPDQNKKYLWNFEISYSEWTDFEHKTGLVSKTEPSLIGMYSEDGRSISEVLEFYKASDSGVSAPSYFTPTNSSESGDIRTQMTGSGWSTGSTGTTDSNRFIWNITYTKYTKGTIWEVTVPHLIGVQGEAGVGKAVSMAFCRSTSDLSAATVSGGSYSSPYPTSTVKAGQTVEGLSWTDGIPDGDAPVWMVKAQISETDSSVSAWSSPVKIVDSVDLDVEYSAIREFHPITRTSGNVVTEIHGQDAAATAAKLASDGQWRSTPSSEAIWMATSKFSNGAWGNWVYTKIKGEVPSLVITTGTSSSLLMSGVPVTAAWEDTNFSVYLISPLGSEGSFAEVPSSLSDAIDKSRALGDTNLIIISKTSVWTLPGSIRSKLEDFGSLGGADISAESNGYFYFVGRPGLSGGQAYEGISTEISTKTVEIPFVLGSGPIWNGANGSNGESSITSFVFAKSKEDLSGITPSGGSYTSPFPGDPVTGQSYYSQTYGSVTVRWYDTIPQTDPLGFDAPVWMTKATFPAGSNNPGNWTKPIKISDNQEFDVEYTADTDYTPLNWSYVDSGHTTPGMSGEIHGHTYGTAKEYCRKDSNSTGWKSEGVIDPVWMAQSYYSGGTWSGWTYTRIKGEASCLTLTATCGTTGRAELKKEGVSYSQGTPGVDSRFILWVLDTITLELESEYPKYYSNLTSLTTALPQNTGKIVVIASTGSSVSATGSDLTKLQSYGGQASTAVEAGKRLYYFVGRYALGKGQAYEYCSSIQSSDSSVSLSIPIISGNGLLWSGAKGQDGESSKTSFVFCRTTTDLASLYTQTSDPQYSLYIPSGGTYPEPIPTNQYDDHSLVWTDSIPETDKLGSSLAPVWMSKATFYSDGNPTGWSKPIKMVDSVDFDVEYTQSESYTPLKWDQVTGSGKTGEIHGHSQESETAKTRLGWGNTGTDAIWMATSQCVNGVWSGWAYTRIKGESPEPIRPNLLDGTGFPNSAVVGDIWNTASGDIGSYQHEGINFWNNSSAGTAGDVVLSQTIWDATTRKIEPGTTYTVSFKACGSGTMIFKTVGSGEGINPSLCQVSYGQGDSYRASGIGVVNGEPDETSNTTEIALHGGWQNYSITFTTRAAFETGLKIDLVISKKSGISTEISIGHLKLESGSSSTAWCLSEADKIGDTSALSIVFCRSTLDLSGASVSGGSYGTQVPTETSIDSSPVNVTWENGVPDGSGSVWMTKRLFWTSASKNSDTSWSTPTKMSDDSDFDVEYSEASILYPLVWDSASIAAYRNANNLITEDPISGTEIHGHESYYTIAKAATPGQWSSQGTSGAIWMATSQKTNGSWGTWVYTRIKGDVPYIELTGTTYTSAENPEPSVVLNGSAEDLSVVGGKKITGNSVGAYTKGAQDPGLYILAISATDLSCIDKVFYQIPSTISEDNLETLESDICGWIQTKITGKTILGIVSESKGSSLGIKISGNFKSFLSQYGHVSDKTITDGHKAFAFVGQLGLSAGCGYSEYSGGSRATLTVPCILNGGPVWNGSVGVSVKLSHAYTRSKSTPAAPVGGSYENPSPVTSGWESEIPNVADSNSPLPLWMSSASFYSDGTPTTWSAPVKLEDSQFFDVEYSTNSELTRIEDQQGHEIHGINAVKQGWTNSPSGAAVWMATSQFKGGAWTNWAYTKIKGEDAVEAKPNLLDGTEFENLERVQNQFTLRGDSSSIEISNTHQLDSVNSLHFTNDAKLEVALVDSGNSLQRIQPGNTYTLSFWLKKTSNSSNRMVVKFGEGTTGITLVSQSSTWSNSNSSFGISEVGVWEQAIYTFKTTGNLGGSINLSFSLLLSSDSQGIYLSKLKLERGSTATEWCLSEYDKKGLSVASITEYYICSNSATTVPPISGSLDTTIYSSTTWQTSPVTPTRDFMYLWNYEISYNKYGEVILRTQPILIGSFGETGRGISGISEYYALGSSGTTPPSGFNVGTSSTTDLEDSSDSSSDSDSSDSEDSESGSSVWDGSGINGDIWKKSPQETTSSQRYLWNATIIQYTGYPFYEVIGPRVIGTHGEAGSNGVGVTKVEQEYLLSTSATMNPVSVSLGFGSGSDFMDEVSDKTLGDIAASTPTGPNKPTIEWYGTTRPSSTNGKYIWYRTKTKYTNDKYIYSSWVCASGENGMTGAVIRMTGVWDSTKDYVCNDKYIDVVIYEGNYYRVKDGVTSATTSPVAEDSSWEAFTNYEAIATQVLLANQGYIDVLGAGSLFIGDTNAAVTHDQDGTRKVGNETLNGWVMTHGSIKHTGTGLELTSDGYLQDPNGLHLRGGLLDKLNATGIDIEEGQINLTADNFNLRNNSGQETLYIDQNGDLNLTGYMTESRRTLSAASDFFSIFTPFYRIYKAGAVQAELTSTNGNFLSRNYKSYADDVSFETKDAPLIVDELWQFDSGRTTDPKPQPIEGSCGSLSAIFHSGCSEPKGLPTDWGKNPGMFGVSLNLLKASGAIDIMWTPRWVNPLEDDNEDEIKASENLVIVLPSVTTISGSETQHNYYVPENLYWNVEQSNLTHSYKSVPERTNWGYDVWNLQSGKFSDNDHVQHHSSTDDDHWPYAFNKISYKTSYIPKGWSLYFAISGVYESVNSTNLYYGSDGLAWANPVDGGVYLRSIEAYYSKDKKNWVTIDDDSLFSSNDGYRAFASGTLYCKILVEYSTSYSGTKQEGWTGVIQIAQIDIPDIHFMRTPMRKNGKITYMDYTDLLSRVGNKFTIINRTDKSILVLNRYDVISGQYTSNPNGDGYCIADPDGGYLNHYSDYDFPAVIIPTGNALTFEITAESIDKYDMSVLWCKPSGKWISILSNSELGADNFGGNIEINL